jgi:hypothetical protein
VGLRARLDTEATGKILYLCWGVNPDSPVCGHYKKAKSAREMEMMQNTNTMHEKNMKQGKKMFNPEG